MEAEEKKVEGDKKTGIRILLRALEVPTRQIAENSGLDAGAVADKMRHGEGTSGFDAAKGVLLAEATVTEIPEPKKSAVGVSHTEAEY